MEILVVGAGPAGLAAGRHALPLLTSGDASLTIVEKSDKIGGIWNRNSESPVYRDLHTNLPKELMAFPDLDFQEESKSYVHHSSVSDYLQQYADKFQLQKYIQFETEVVEVAPANVGARDSRWKVTLLCRRSGVRRQTEADLIIVTGVRESQPRVPDIASQFGGFQCHSSQYRHPAQEQFVQKSVLIVGGGLSGIDIAVDIASTARTVMISAERGLVPVRKSLGDNVIKDVMKDGRFRVSGQRVWLAGGSEEGEEVDSIVWCTGYHKMLDFLSPSCGLRIVEEGHVLEPLYMHYINIHYPSMAVMHLNPGNVPFPQMDLQARAFLKLHFSKLLPSGEDMMDWLKTDIQWRHRLGVPARHRHKLTGGRLFHWGSYMNQLAAIANVDPISEVVERMFLYAMVLVIVKGLPDARKVIFKLNVSRTNFSIWPNGLRVNLLYWILVVLMKMGVLQ